MELTSKQRAQLRSMANSMEAVVHIGKGDLGENLIRQTDEALEARELIKCRVWRPRGSHPGRLPRHWAGPPAVRSSR